jgi:hypothetical protein
MFKCAALPRNFDRLAAENNQCMEGDFNDE